MRQGSPKKQTPGFQREWVPLSSSGVLMEDITAQPLVEAPSSNSLSGTIYLWGLCFATGQEDVCGGTIKDDDGNIITSVLATSNGPFFLGLDTPIRLTQNSRLMYHKIVHKAQTYCTPLYTVLHTKGEVEGGGY